MALTKVPSNLDAAVSVTQSQSDNSTNVATTAYVDTAISNLSDSAPAALNTLNEIAAALGDDANYAATTTAAIADKLPLSGGAMTGPITTNSTFDGVDIAARDAILTSTTTTANAALPKAGGTMTGPLTVNVTGSDVDAVTITGGNVTDFDFVANPPEFNLEDTSSNSGTKRARITVNSNQFQIHALPDDDTAVSHNLFIADLSSGNVGIGTTSPLDLLHIKSTSTDARQVIDGHTGYDAELKFAEGGTVKYTIGHDAATDSFIIGTTNVDTQKRLVIDSSGNVGIGTNSPQQLLEVHKAAGGDQTVAKFSAHNYGDTGKTFIEIGTEYGDGSSRIGSFNDTGNSSVLVFDTHSATSGQFTERMRIDSSGNVGIGLTSPIDTKLVIKEVPATIVSGNAIHGSTMKGIKLISTLNGDESNGIWFGTNGTHWSGISGQRKNSASTWGTTLSFYTHEDAVADLTYARERMRIDPAGNVGIGTTSPTSKLHISNNAAPADDLTLLTLQNGNSTGDISTPDTWIDFVFRDTNTNVTPQARIGAHAGDGGDANTQILEGKGYLTFHTSGTTAESGDLDPPERMRIDSSGRIIVGSAIHFSGNTSSGFIYEDGVNLQLRSDGAMTFYTYSGSWQVRMTIADGGLISGDFNDTSDVALKENIVAIENGMSVISQMRPVSFDWRDVIGEDKEGNEVTVPAGKGPTKGLIAQEVEAIDSELVVGEEGEKAINTSGVLAYAIKAIQEQQALIESLTARITALEG